MLVRDAINIIRGRINDEFDTGYEPGVLINYINDAIKYLSHALIARNEPVLVKWMELDSSKENFVPNGFVRFAGGYPIRRLGDRFYVIDEKTTINAKYFCLPDEVKAEDDEMPFANNDTYRAIICNLAAIYALNQHEFNVERDTAMRQELEQIIIQSLGTVG